MKVILAMVTSVDGKSTKNTLPPKEWASKEDQKFFSSVFKQNRLFVMGSHTYLAAQHTIKPNPKKLKIVLTKNPKKFIKYAVAGQLEFTNNSPASLVKQLEHLGYRQIILLGGAKTNTAFFKANLVNEIWLTLEPLIFGVGKGLVDERKLDTKLKLKSSKKLNSKGSLLLKYEVI